MAAKSVNVMVRVEPKIKEQAEAILSHLGLPVSVVINSLYRQIIMNNRLPFPLTIPRAIPSRDAMTKEEFDAMMQQGLEQANAGQGLELDETFANIRDSI